jgi:type VII secretion protein EccB
VCDVASPPPSSTVTTTVIAGAVHLENGALEMPKDRYALVTVNGQVYLIYDGRRASVDLTNPAVTRALRLEGITPRPISMSVLDAIPEMPAIAPPPIPDAGAPSPITTGGVRVGSVVKVSRADSTEYYVVLPTGVQRINEVTADLIRFADSQGAQDIVAVAPDVTSGHPSLNILAVQTFPERAGKTVDVPEKSVLCSNWTPGQAGTQEHATTKLVIGNSLPLKTDQVPVVLAQADKDGPNVDAMYLPPGRSAFVKATGLGGDTGRAESLHLVLDTGVRFGVGSLDAAKSLGMTADAIAAPWPIVELLPPGPRLSKEDALVVHDGMPPDKSGLAINPETPGVQPPS